MAKKENIVLQIVQAEVQTKYQHMEQRSEISTLSGVPKKHKNKIQTK